MLHPPSLSDSAKAIPYIQEGRIVALPTGTSYGLAADALQGNALQRLRNLKKRPQDKVFTVFLRLEILSAYFITTPAEDMLIHRLTGKPVTILLRPTKALEHIAHNGLVGLRLIDHPLMQQLADLANVPLTATSANLAGQPPCHTPDCIRQAFPWQIEDATYDLSLAAILDAGELPPSSSSTILKQDADSLKVIRPGAFDPSSL